MVAVSFLGYGMPLDDAATALWKRLYLRPLCLAEPSGALIQLYSLPDSTSSSG
jgi:hypothetical protein